MEVRNMVEKEVDIFDEFDDYSLYDNDPLWAVTIKEIVNDLLEEYEEKIKQNH